MVHTHSTYATAWAARGEPIPCVLTDDRRRVRRRDPGRPVRADRRRLDRPRHRRDPARAPLARRADAQPRRRSPSARDARAAVKAAVMCEDVARTVHIARQLGDAAADRPGATSTRSTTATRTSTARPEDVAPTDMQRASPRSGSSPAARASTGPRPSTRSPSSRRRSQPPSTPRRGPAGPRSSGSRCSPSADAIRRVLLEANRDDRLHRRDRLDAHVLARRRCGSAGWTRCASRCCTCTPRPTQSLPWARSTWTS